MWILFVNWFLILGLMLVVVLLWVRLNTYRSIVAEVLDIHTEALRRHDAVIMAPPMPKYTGAEIQLPMDCQTPEETVTAMTHAHIGAPWLADPDGSPFFVGEGDK